MVRSLKRKAIEEIYGMKFEKPVPAKFPVNNNSVSMTKTINNRMERVGGATDRVARKSTHGDVRTKCAFTTPNNYVITSDCPVTATNMRSTANAHPHPHQHQLQQQQQHIPQQQQQQQLLANAYAPSARRRASGTAAVRVGHTKASHAREDAKPRTGSDGKSAKLKEEGVLGKPLTHRGLSVVNNDLAGCYNSGDSRCSDKEERADATGLTVTHRYEYNHRQHGHRHRGHQQHHHTTTQHRHAHRAQRVSKEEDDLDADNNNKDNDPEEFFELIRHTVQNAIGTIVADVVQRSFRELHTKLERFSAELKQTNENLNVLQDHIVNKVTHYGEENSRHFRYLCMKSDYDKLFYQHQASLGGNDSNKQQQSASTLVTTSKSTQMSHVGNQSQVSKAALPLKKRSGEKSRRRANAIATIVPSNNTNDANDCAQVSNPCVCHSTNKQQPPLSEARKSSSDDSVVTHKSSEMGMHAVLEHIQRFCTLMQLSDFNPGQQLKDKFNTKDMLLNINDTAGNPKMVAPMPKKHMPGRTTTRTTATATTTAAAAAAATAPTASASIVDIYSEGKYFEYGTSSSDSAPSDGDEVVKYIDNLTRRGARLESTKKGGGGGGDGD